MIDKKITWLIIGISLMAIALGIGWLRFEHKQEELKRNREYEVSLVKALKNSYAGIEEIRISDPHYSDKPGSWSCYVKLKFQDGITAGYHISHDRNLSRNKSAVTTAEISDLLKEHFGTTTNKVKVIYSDKQQRIE